MRTIRARLYLAFALAAAMTVVGSLFALFASATIGATLNEIVFHSMPATVESIRLSEDTSDLIAFAPRLMAVENENQRIAVAKDVANQSTTLKARITRLRDLDAGEGDELGLAQSAMSNELDVLNRTVAARIQISAQRRALAIAARKAHEDLLETITPAIDDANFNVMMQMRPVMPAETVDLLRRLLEIQADANLLAGLLIEASMVTDIANLPPLRDSIAAAERNIDGNLRELPQSDVRDSLAGLYDKLAVLSGDKGIVAQRAAELKSEQDAQQVFAAALVQASQLKDAVETLIGRQGVIARTLSARAVAEMKFSRIVLTVLSVVALAGAGLIAWLYVGRSIVGRLAALSGAMRRIADGESGVTVAVGGRDEIAGMAQALLVFRQAMADVTAARQADAEHARTSELRRQQLETATQNFEREVNAIVQALDGASKTMDECAQIMAEAASHNQIQANATAAASEEATANVSNVAMAAEEIAQSVEQISTQARASAEIARHTSGETKSIISAVERLAATVGQINSVSNLIRDVAAQTNLLALNATIEAARAGAAGRGFAVVAQEVKTLAAQTEKSTGDITKQISLIEATTSNVVAAMKAIAGTIGQLDENANEIAVAVQQQDAVSKEIARSAIAAAERTREVSASVVQVSDAATKTGQLAGAVLNAGSELAEKSGRLRAEVERFLAQVRVA
ncbi:MAG TPA: methyl-accepting chemotaxis protein [Xanthobacteraceae bacterium]|nr:methyl-accepting chemotaxis protein [Xanthobacteraceae bacterium]